MNDKIDTWRILTNEAGNYYAQSNEAERERFRGFLKGILHEGEVTVDFVKADGSERTMKCTLSDEHGAKYSVNENKEKTKAPNPNVCVVWDCNQSAWRSFRWDRIKKVSFNLG